MTTVSAPGKLMLMGEHAVVYGQPCIVTAVDQRLIVGVEKNTSGRTIIDAPQVRDLRFVEACIAEFKKSYNTAGVDGGLSVSIRSQFSSSVGFGSSSAVTVALLKALSLEYAVGLTERDIFDLAYAVVLRVQGVGSGFDVASALYGGTLYFKKGGEVIEPLHNGVPIVVGYTGVKADTVRLVEHVKNLQERYPEKVDRIFSAIGKLVESGKEAIEGRDRERLGTLFTFNQEYLRDLGVSTEKLETLIAASKKAGAYGAKLSGAGGGDCMIAVVSEENRGRVESAIREAGGEVMNVTTHAPGAIIIPNERISSREGIGAPA